MTRPDAQSHAPIHGGTPWTWVPWHVAEGPSEVRCAEGWLVCTTSSDDHARLIAAAPELLDALRKLTFMARTGGQTAGRDDALCAACDAAEAAMAKVAA